MITHSPLVGAFHRPPAKAIIDFLPQGAELKLLREPSNEFDSFAVAVWARIAQIPSSQHEALALALSGYGHTLESLFAQSEWHLGYIAAKAPRGMPDAFAFSAAVGSTLDRVPAPGYAAKLLLDGAGRPLVEIDWTITVTKETTND